MALKNPDKYSGLILFAPAIRDNEENARFGKKFIGILGTLVPTTELIA
jgi:hypothetical protein